MTSVTAWMHAWRRPAQHGEILTPNSLREMTANNARRGADTRWMCAHGSVCHACSAPAAAMTYDLHCAVDGYYTTWPTRRVCFLFCRGLRYATIVITAIVLNLNAGRNAIADNKCTAAGNCVTDLVANIGNLCGNNDETVDANSSRCNGVHKVSKIFC